MNISKLVLHPLATNCYIVATSDKNAVVIDPADNAEAIREALSSLGLTLKAILLTHGHFDHTGAVADLIACSAIPVYIHEDDIVMLTDPTKALAFFCPDKPFTEVRDNINPIKHGDTITQDSVTFEVMHTPGHSAGSVCFIIENDGEDDGRKIMFAGDTIFKDSIGRSDGYSGSPIVQQQTLDMLKALKDDYIIYPGHGPSTTLSEEKKYNPFIADF